MKEMYKLTKSETLRLLASAESGLSPSEAEARLKRFGENRLAEGKKKSLAGLFFAQFKDLMTLLLLCAALLSGILAYVTHTPSEIADAAILLAVILLNAVVGFIQQYRADSAIEKLKKLSAETAKAVRGGTVRQIDATLLVPGDVIELNEGDRIPADCRILESEGFRADESALTGESAPAGKRDCLVNSSSLSERRNTVHMGTFCVGGTARCVVTATGMNTEMGQIARLLHASAPVPSPLDKTVAKLGKIVTATVLAVAAVLFVCGLLARRMSLLENFMTAVAVAVAAIPEGMGAVVTVILAVGMQRMSRARTVMRRLSAVETLGSCTCICSDKTGTLTENKMTVTAIATRFGGGALRTSSGARRPEDPQDEAEFYTGSPVQRRLLACMRMCHSVKGSAGGYLGDPTEIALLEYADRVGFALSGRRLGGIPFSSERKRMSVLADCGTGPVLYVKGGVETVLSRCAFVAGDEGQKRLAPAERTQILRTATQFAAEGQRVLAFAERAAGKSGDLAESARTNAAAGELSQESEEELVFLGLAAMYDPPKRGAKEAIAACRRAGVRTVMITGDSPDTAFAIARELGIAKDRSEVVTGEELDQMGERAPSRAVISVYARVSPGHKQQIVKQLQARGEVVAMTGDGVNDAPSVRAADIGVAMGGGTDVTKNAADMVLENGDLSALVSAVEEGRNVFARIKRTISFFLATNLAEVLAVLVATLFLWKFRFLTSTQLLWINLITDSLPVLALGMEKTEGMMERPPVAAGEIFSRRSVLFMLTFGVLQAAITVGLFVYGVNHWGNAAATTCAFFVLSFLELFHAFNVRKEGRTTLKELFSSHALLLTAAIGILLNVALVFVPFLAHAFDLVPLNGVQWALVFGCSFAIFPLGELYKAVCSARRKARPRLLHAAATRPWSK